MKKKDYSEHTMDAMRYSRIMLKGNKKGMLKAKAEKLFWKVTSIICIVTFLAFAPLAFVQADGRIILQILVSLVLGTMTVILWEVVKEAFNN
ncbi:MAG: hypothetical protein PF542_06510 [Nanoarchaeota archaeon]|jgi:fatty acid desaturase|nr:hypothetical protein [Nanoarchaeota archaeon]